MDDASRWRDGNAWLARTGMDEEKKNGCASGSFHAAATDAVKLTVPDVKQSSSRLLVNTFNLNIREHEAEQFEHERSYYVAEALAKELTTHPTMPQRMLESHEPEVAARSGMWLGTSSCAFKGCMWQCDAMELGDYQARDGADQARDGADHPWDQCLHKHICQAHGHIITKVFESYFCSTPADDTMWDVYCEAVAVQERMRYPVVGSSVDRRAFAYTASTYNDERIHAYICFICSAIKVDTGRIRSNIEMKSGK